MLTIINLNSITIDTKIINQAIIHLKNGGLVIYPTDTSYGLGALLSNKKAIENIYKLKGREKSKQLSVVIPNIEWAKDNLDVNQEQERIIRYYLPGKFTFILKYQNNIKTLGVRIPKSNCIQMLVKKIREPVTATSANVSGQNDCFCVDELKNGILKTKIVSQLDILVLDGGPLKIGERSTVVDLTKTPPVVLRQGSGKFYF